MLTLTNEQRACFGLSPVDPAWRLLSLPRSKYDEWDTFAYIDDASRTIRKVIKDSDAAYGSFYYHECEVNETLSEDGGYILPKTVKGKPVRLSAATLDKRPGVGMYLACSTEFGYVTVANYTTQQTYFDSAYDERELCTTREAFTAWVEKWCAETTLDDLTDVAEFAARERVRVKYREGDFFRFKINRRLYGYGRLLIDYNKKREVPLTHPYMAKPLMVAVYRILTENPSLTPDDLRNLPLLPAEPIMDNALFYGSFPIIGHAPPEDAGVDYPIFYDVGMHTDRVLSYQRGTEQVAIPRTLEGLPQDMRRFYGNRGIGFDLNNFSLPILEACIAADSNDPYWELNHSIWMEDDLRNPRNRELHERIRALFGLPEI